MTTTYTSFALLSKVVLLTCVLSITAACNQRNSSTPEYLSEPKKADTREAVLPAIVGERAVAGVALPAPPPLSDSITNPSAACRAVIASLNGRSFNTIRDSGAFEGNQSVRYTRVTDGKVFRYACKFRGNDAIWAMIDERGAGTGIGAWAGNGSGLRTIRVTEVASKVVVEVIWQDGNRENYEY